MIRNASAGMSIRRQGAEEQDPGDVVSVVGFARRSRDKRLKFSIFFDFFEWLPSFLRFFGVVFDFLLIFFRVVVYV